MPHSYRGDPTQSRRPSGKIAVFALCAALIAAGATVGSASRSDAATSIATAAIPATARTAATATPDATASVVLTDPATSDGITAGPGDTNFDPSSVATTEGGRACWQLSGSGDSFVYATLGAAYKHSGLNNATISVDYYDQGSAEFAIQYDAQSSAFKDALNTTTSNSGTWKTATAFVTDAVFQNGTNGADLRVGLYDPSFGQSAGPLCIGAIRITPSAVPTPDARVVIGSNDGIFSTTDSVSFPVQAATPQVDWAVRGSNGVQLDAGTAAIDSSGNGTISIGRLPVDAYTLRISAVNGSTVVGTHDVDFAVSAGAVTPATGPSAFFAVNTHQTRLTSADAASVEHASSAAGISGDRDDAVYWNNVEPTAGVYTFSAQNDADVAAMVKAGQQPLLLLGFSNPLYDQGQTPYSDAGIEAAGEYAAAVAKHYASEHVALEVWNEYYGGFSNGPCAQSPDCYAKLLKSVYQHVKAVSPSTEVVGGVTFKVPVDWFTQLFKDGGLQYLDAVSIHPYRSPGKPEGLQYDVGALQQLMKSYGTPKPIWITEAGWVTGDGPVSVSATTQAEYLARSNMIAMGAGVQRAFWYDMLDDGTDPGNGEDNFGLLAAADSGASGMTPKPSYLADQTQARLLSHASYLAQNNVGDAAVYSYTFATAAGRVQAVWSDDGAGHPISFAATGPVTLTNLYGATTTLTPVNGHVVVTADASPVYLSGGGVSSPRSSTALSLSTPASPVAAGSGIPATVRYDPSALGITGPSTATVSIDGKRYTLNSTGRPVSRTVLTAGSTQAATRRVDATASVRGAVFGEAESSSSVTAAKASVSIAPALVAGRSGPVEQLSLTVANPDPAAGLTVSSLKWTYGSQSGTVAAGFSVSAGSSKTVTVPIEAVAYYTPVAATAQAQIAGSATVTDSENFGFSPAFPASPRLVKGQLTGLAGVPAIDLSKVGSYGGSANSSQLTGTMWLSYDRDYLYVAADAVQPDFVVQSNPLWLEAGDNLGIGVEPGKAAAGIGSWGAQWYNFYAGQTTTGPAAFLESLPLTGPAGVRDDVKVSVYRDAATDHTRYLVAIPWREVAGVSPQSGAFSLTLDLDRNDRSGAPGWRGAGLAGWLEWGDGLNTFQLANYQTVVFAPSR